MRTIWQKILAFFMSVLAFFGIGKKILTAIPDGTCSGRQGQNHAQGMAVDEKNGYIYYSFTTRLVKTDFEGNLIGSVTGLVGHLGCISFNKADGLVYGSLEYKHDAIGQGLLDQTGAEVTDGFYIAIFDADKITRENMSAETDGVMRAAFLPQVLADHTGTGVNKAGETVPHKYGCSGIDGLCTAPLPGQPDGDRYIYVAYGVYSDLSRDDNDHQVLLCYAPDDLEATARPLSQAEMHKNGPAQPLRRYFVFTGNTEYGVQNLEYDPGRALMFLAVYHGKKPAFENYDIFAVDLSRPAAQTPLRGLDESGLALTLSGAPGSESTQITGWRFAYGPYGIFAKADGDFYIAEPTELAGEQAARVYTYRFDPENGFFRA